MEKMAVKVKSRVVEYILSSSINSGIYTKTESKAIGKNRGTWRAQISAKAT